MEFILSILFAPWALILYVLVAVFLEHKTHSGWAVFFGLLIVIGLSPWGISNTFTWTELLIGAAAYIPIGIIWSFWRFSRFCNKIVNDVKNNIIDKRFAESKLNVANQFDRIVLWVFAWPFSLVQTITGDVINLIEKLVRTVFRNSYIRISERAIKQLEKL